MKEKMLRRVQGLTLFLLLLVVGVFWGNYFSFSRSFHLFSATELIHVAQILVDNLALPMRFMSVVCMALLGLNLYLMPGRKSKESYFVWATMLLLGTALVLTVVIEVPINDQIVGWTPDTVPSNWEALRNRWQFVNVIRTIAAVSAFILFVAAVVRPFDRKINNC